jgi:hypothetical protein
MNRTQALMAAFGQHGGTVHDICKEIGCDVEEFLYNEIEEWNIEHKKGWFVYRTCSLNFNQKSVVERKGNLQFWLGVVSGVLCSIEQQKPLEKKF